MKLHKEEQKLIQTPNEAAKQRFQIEKLEERIAPARGGIPGKPPGDTFCLYDCKPGWRNK